MKEKDFDCYQRYTALKNLMDAAFPDATADAPATVLDVGSGSSTLSRDFLGDRFRVTRSDVVVDTAAGADIVILQPGQPLPFEARAFDAVIAMDVLEHVRPAEREPFVRECLRVARDACVLAAPAASPAIEEAEARVYRVHQARLGTHAYFEEHSTYGLPAAEDVGRWIRAEGAALVTLPNVPLVAWETFSSLDFIGYSKPDTVDLTMDAHFIENAACPAVCNDGVHYRTFYVACRTPEAQGRLERAVDDLRRRAVPLGAETPLELAWQVIAASCMEARKARSQAHDADTQRAQCAVELAQTASQLAVVRAQLADVQRHKQEIEAYLQQQLKLLVEYQSSLDAIFKSRSWRYMEIFRRAARALRRLKGR